MVSGSDLKVFDRANYLEIDEARKNFLSKFLPELIEAYGLKTAIDVGCGLGFFTNYLSGLGLGVIGTDGRPENVAEGRRRYPKIRFDTCNIEDPLINRFGCYDITLCLGLLYHLENPFLAIRALAAITHDVLIIETRVAPGKSPIAALVDENIGADQAMNYSALIPSESCFLKMLYEAGFPYTYRTTCLPEHKEFHGSLLRKKMRTFLIASKIELRLSMLRSSYVNPQLNHSLWWRCGLGPVIQFIRGIARRHDSRGS